MCSSNFHQLDLIMESDHLDSFIGSIFNLRYLFTRICIDNPLEAPQNSASIVFQFCWHSQILSQWQLRVFTIVLLSLQFYCRWPRGRAFNHFRSFFRMSPRSATYKASLSSEEETSLIFWSRMSMAVKPSSRKWQSNSSFTNVHVHGFWMFWNATQRKTKIWELETIASCSQMQLSRNSKSSGRWVSS